MLFIAEKPNHRLTLISVFILPSFSYQFLGIFAKNAPARYHPCGFSLYNSLMEQLNTSDRIESISIHCASPPICDVLHNANQVAVIWPEYADELLPQIEQHANTARDIILYLDDLANNEATPVEKERFYDATSSILQDPERQRFALFLPFESFPTPDENSASANLFRQSYLDAWWDLLYAHDFRDNFLDGGLPEIEARSEDPARIVKAAHLTPWIIQSGMLSSTDAIHAIIDTEDKLALRGLFDTEPMLEDFSLLRPEDRTLLSKINSTLPPAKPPKPLKFISPAREAWLKERERPASRPESQTQDLSLPLSEHIHNIYSEIVYAADFATSLDPATTYNIAWLGGSRLKGYGRPNSDIDICIPTREKHLNLGNDILTAPLPEIFKRPQDYAHEVFNTVWTGNQANILELQRTILPIYFQTSNETIRRQTIERLEHDLLEYRLMHKGFARFYPDSNPEYKKYTAMDGQSTFYETNYRIVASKIYANSIFLPRTTKTT